MTPSVGRAMILRLLPVTTLALALASTATLVGANAQHGRASGLLAEYYDVLEQYLTGEPSWAVSEMAAWDARRAARHVRELIRQRQHASVRLGRNAETGSDRFTRAAVAVHTEVYLRASGASQAATADHHLEHARTLLSLLDRSDHGPFMRQWYAVVTATHHAGLRLTEARAMLEEGLRQFPDDEHLLVAAGSVHETLASPRVGLPRLPLSSAEEPPHEVAEHLRRAETFYRRALERNAESAEARLRLGRALLDLGAPHDALRELARVGDAGTPSVLRYSATLLSGRAHEQAGRLDEAAAFYRAAGTACPRCQVPAIALSAVLARAGDRESAAAAMTTMLEASASETASSDPWHFYDFGPRWRLDEIRLRFREAARS